MRGSRTPAFGRGGTGRTDEPGRGSGRGGAAGFAERRDRHREDPERVEALVEAPSGFPASGAAADAGRVIETASTAEAAGLIACPRWRIQSDC